MYPNRLSPSGNTLWIISLAAPLCWFPQRVVADRWDAPTPEHWSANRRYVLTVDYGLFSKNRIRLFRVDDERRVKVWGRGYVETYAPHMAYVSNDGRRVILRDSHSSIGRGKVLIFLDESGKELRHYELNDLLTDYERTHVKMTSSSTWWSEPGWFALMDDDRRFAFVTNQGTVACFDTGNGAQIEITETLRRQIVADATSDAIAWLQFENPRDRAAGLTMLGALSANEHISEIKKFLDDNEALGVGCLGRPESCGPNLIVQIEAAKALGRILGKESLPIIEEKLDEQNLYAFYSLLHVMESIDYRDFFEPKEPFDPDVVRYWEKQMQSDSKRIRDFATIRRLQRDDGNYIRLHREFLNSKEDGIRWNAFKAFIKKATDEDAEILRAATGDSFQMVRSTAQYALKRLDPEFVENLPDSDKDFGLKVTKLQMLGDRARRGERAPIDSFLSGLEAMANHSHGADGRCSPDAKASLACQLAAECKWPAAREPLERALANPCERIQRMAAIGLSAFGDATAIAKLRDFAMNGDSFDRSRAIRALGAIRDASSKPLLEEAQYDREKWVCEAAREALKNFDSPDDNRK
jgi:HEAT repeat protein